MILSFRKKYSSINGFLSSHGSAFGCVENGVNASMHTCIRQLDGLSEGCRFGTKRGSNAPDGSQILLSCKGLKISQFKAKYFSKYVLIFCTIGQHRK